jgi:hypothetical protein
LRFEFKPSFDKSIRSLQSETKARIKETRILFRWRGDFVEFILAGSHDHTKRFLREI